MSYYSSYNNNSLGFYTTLKMKQSKDQPNDTIHVIVNDPHRSNQHNFIAAGWDGVLRYYRIIPKTTQEIQMVYSRFLQHPILSVTFGNDAMVFAGLATGDIVAVDMGNNQSGVVGSHDAPIVLVTWIKEFNLLISLGYDNKLKFWDLQNQNNNFLAKQIDLPFKTHTAAFDYPYLLIGTADSKIGIFNFGSLPNMKIPDSSSFFDVIEIGSKFHCSAINAKKMLYGYGCVDGRCMLSPFYENYQGIKLESETNKRILSKSMKKQSSYSHSPLYGQVSNIIIGIQNDRDYLILVGTQEISFFNTSKRDKPRRIKVKGTAGRVSLDGKYFIYAEGNDWCEGINDLKKLTKPKIEAIKYSKSELEGFVALKV